MTHSNSIDQVFTRAQEVNASTHDLASSLAIAIWREMNNWQGEDKDRDFIKLHAGAKRVQEEITIMLRGIRLILEAERERCAQIVIDVGHQIALDAWEWEEIAAAIRASDEKGGGA